MTLQSWGCFIIAVAAIVHQARNFDSLEAQRGIARGLVLCFSLLALLYASILLLHFLEIHFYCYGVMGEEYMAGVAATGSVFAFLLVLYLWGLNSGGNDGENKKK